MLVLSRHQNERITIDCHGERISVCIVEIRGDRVRLGFEADKEVKIYRNEVWDKIEREDAA